MANNTEIIVHETGHSSASVNNHENAPYKYFQQGLQSNKHGQVYPSEQNTKDLLNDKTNRSTIKTP